jgi:hypothetical protein
VIAVISGAVFGGSDQYLGSLSAIPWLTDVSLLSAPWLLLPFIFGCTQRSSRRAVIIGCVATTSALVAYFVMTLSPMEGVHLNGSVAPVLGLLRSESKVIAGGVVIAPLYGYLGYRWRTNRAWISAILVGGAICLEPLASTTVGRLPQFTEVWVAEIVLGLLVTGYLVWTGILYRFSLGVRPRGRW